jgi:hypothetical protein
MPGKRGLRHEDLNTERVRTDSEDLAHIAAQEPRWPVDELPQFAHECVG